MNSYCHPLTLGRTGGGGGGDFSEFFPIDDTT